MVYTPQLPMSHLTKQFWMLKITADHKAEKILRKERIDTAEYLRLAPSDKMCDDRDGEGIVGKKKRK